jgi:hypothetical protein
MRIFLVLIFFSAWLGVGWAQTQEGSAGPPGGPPTPIELFAGHRGLFFQLIMSKRFSPGGRLGFFSVNNFVGDYTFENRKSTYLSQSFVTFDLWKKLSVNAGATMTDVNGLRPTAALQYVVVNPKVLAVFLLPFDLVQTYKLGAFGLVEYKPKFTPVWGLYTRVQTLYIQNTRAGNHQHSFVWLRVGASYKNYQFGWGTNLDFLGAAARPENSMGVFVKADLH